MAETVNRGGTRQILANTVASRRREVVEQAIEAAAIELLSAGPTTEVTVEDIANRAGVGARTLYRYFPTKDDILAAYPRRGAALLADRIRARPSDETPFVALRNSAADVYGNMDRSEHDRWIVAVANSTAIERIALAALRTTADALSGALAERIGANPDDLWPAVAGNMAAAAMQVGTRFWLAHHGDYVDCQLAALEVARHGLQQVIIGSAPSTDRMAIA